MELSSDGTRCLDMSQNSIWEVFRDFNFLVKIWSSKKAAGFLLKKMTISAQNFVKGILGKYNDYLLNMSCLAQKLWM